MCHANEGLFILLLTMSCQCVMLMKVCHANEQFVNELLVDNAAIYILIICHVNE